MEKHVPDRLWGHTKRFVSRRATVARKIAQGISVLEIRKGPITIILTAGAASSKARVLCADADRASTMVRARAPCRKCAGAAPKF